MSKPHLQKQATLGSYTDHYPSSISQRRSPLAECQRSSSLDSPFARPFRTAKLSSSFPGAVTARRRDKFSKMSALSENRASPLAGQRVFEEIREDEEEEEVGMAVGDVSERTNAKAFTIEEVQEEEEGEEVSGSNSVGVSGMEVSNTNTETTVVLQHLLAMSGRGSAASAASSHNSMAIIEEDEEEEEEKEEQFYESQDAPLSASSPTSTFFLPHPIPRLIITDENQRLVETVVQTTKEYSAGAAQFSPEALLAEEGEESTVLATRL